MNKNNFTQVKKRHSIKNLVITDKIGKIVFISPTFSGKVHDKTIAELLPISKKCTLMTDLGFYGWKLPDVCILMPHKKPKNKELSALQKQENQDFSKKRVRIENIFAKVKILRIVKDTIRTYIQETKNTVFKIAVALYNFRNHCAGIRTQDLQ